ncbi:SLATT domain-containing protein [Alloacidobacterium sp.]|uniref:SLATT domain-containing protein n=1 Tax=Alloacidobacterium sp. TaxID=2951999 RepID=UPI002D473319|nr:SLATT domain-containing protein [Alloacidobacterium sp.]HYK36949.1 SLATT domain-containing protein [Alloacidobacterium sp.]
MPSTQRFFEPGSQRELLRGWLIHAHKGRDRHDTAARIYEWSKYVFGTAAIILSTIVGTSVFQELAAKSTVSLWVGLLSVAAAVLSALQTFLDFPARAERHRAAGVKYKAVIRSLEHSLATLAAGGAPTEDQITQIQQRLDELEDSAPVIMPRIYSMVERRYADVEYVQEALGLYRS